MQSKYANQNLGYVSEKITSVICTAPNHI